MIAAQVGHELAGIEVVAGLRQPRKAAVVRRFRQSHRQPSRQLLVDLVAADEVDVQRLVAVLGQQQRPRRGAVAAGPTGLLVVRLERRRHAGVKDGSHVRLVHAHAERVGGDDDPNVVAEETALDGSPPVAVEPGVIRQRLLPEGVREHGGQVLRARARARVDDRGQRTLASQGLDHQPVLLVRRRPSDREGQVGPVEAGGHAQRVAQAEARHDVGGHTRGRRCCRGHDRPRAQPPGGIRQPEVVGPEVVPPLGHAVRLVDHEQPHPGGFEALDEPGRGETLRRDVQEAQLPARRGGDRGRVVGGVPLRVDHRGELAEPARAERVHLVLHERDQRGDDHREVVPHQGGQLIAERFARAGGHDHQHVAVVERGLARLPLPSAEAGEAEALAKCPIEVHTANVQAGSAGVGAERPAVTNLLQTVAERLRDRRQRRQP